MVTLTRLHITLYAHCLSCANFNLLLLVVVVVVLFTIGSGSFPGVKRPGRGADPTPPSKCRGHGRVGLYLYFPSGPSWPVMEASLPLFITIIIIIIRHLPVISIHCFSC